MSILDAATQIVNELNSTSDQINRGLVILGWMIVIVIALIGVIWANSEQRNNKTEYKVDKLAEQVTRLITLMEFVLPETKENSTKINEINQNCATNGHQKRKTA
jgi:uncharacterized protein HemX